MPTIRMRALKALPYGGRTVSEGEEFDVSRPIEALALSYQRKAQILEGMRVHLETAQVSAEPSQPDPDSTETVVIGDGSADVTSAGFETSEVVELPRRRRRYRRRDLTAEPQ